MLDDAEDLDLVAEQVVNGAFWNMGENCSATSRLIVHATVKDELLERIGAYMREWRMGDPLDPENRVGALVSTEHFDKVKSYLDSVKSEKLSVAYGGETQNGIYVEPTVIDGVTPASRLFQEEIFGPILSVTTFNTLAEAMALANDTNYGLAASVYTGKPAQGDQAVAGNPRWHGDRQLLRRRRRDDTIRRLQGIRFRRARQVDLRPRQVHRAEDDLDRVSERSVDETVR